MLNVHVHAYVDDSWISESGQELKYDILSFRMPIARKFTRSAVLRIDADAWKSRLWLCNSMSIRASITPSLSPSIVDTMLHRALQSVAFARELEREDGHRRLSKFLSRVKVCGPTQLWRDGISGARRAATEFRPSNGEEEGIREIDSLRGCWPFIERIFQRVYVSLSDHRV